MAEDPRDWNLETKLVRGGMARTAYGEISEALFLTQSFAYDTAAAADARFAGDSPGFIFSDSSMPGVPSGMKRARTRPSRRPPTFTRGGGSTCSATSSSTSPTRACCT